MKLAIEILEIELKKQLAILENNNLILANRLTSDEIYNYRLDCNQKAEKIIKSIKRAIEYLKTNSYENME